MKLLDKLPLKPKNWNPKSNGTIGSKLFGYIGIGDTFRQEYWRPYFDIGDFYGQTSRISH